MKLLSIAEFISSKQHDGLAVLGSGFSINWIVPAEWEIIRDRYDTWAMNWFCKSKIPVTWYMVREQASVPRRRFEGYNLDDFYADMEQYEKSVKVIKDLSYQPNSYHHSRNLYKLDGPGFVFKEIQGGCSVKSFKFSDIFQDGIHHGKCSLYDTLHFAIGMGYKKILFCGIDLYDNRYCYLSYEKTMPQTEAENRSVDDHHATADKTVKLVENFAAFYPDIACRVHYRRSLLAGVIPVWEKT